MLRTGRVLLTINLTLVAANGQYLVPGWSPTTQLPITGQTCGATTYNNRLLVLTDVPRGAFVGDVQTNGSVSLWRPTLSPPSASRVEDPVLIGGYLVAAGPAPTGSYVARLGPDGSILSWNPAPGTASPSTHSHARVALGNRIYAIAGADHAGNLFSGVEVATIAPDGTLSPWASLTPLPVPINDPMATIIDGYLYVFGGESFGGNMSISRDVRRAPIQPDGTIGLWEFVGLLNEPRPHADFLRFGDTLHITGGGVHGYMTNKVESVLAASLGQAGQHSSSASLPTVLNAMCTSTAFHFGYVIGGNNQAFGGGAQTAVYVAPLAERQFLPASLWVGLKNSDDQGTQFDLRVELYNGASQMLSSGETRCITGVTRNPNLAKQVWVEFGPTLGGPAQAGETVSLKVLTRIGTNPDGTKCSGPGGSHSNAVGLRLYYDSAGRPSGFSVGEAPAFLHSSGSNFSFDGVAPVGGTPKTKDSPSINYANGKGWKEIGTWIGAVH